MELSAIIHQYRDAFMDKYGPAVLPGQLQAMDATYKGTFVQKVLNRHLSFIVKGFLVHAKNRMLILF